MMICPLYVKLVGSATKTVWSRLQSYISSEGEETAGSRHEQRELLLENRKNEAKKDKNLRIKTSQRYDTDWTLLENCCLNTAVTRKRTLMTTDLMLVKIYIFLINKICLLMLLDFSTLSVALPNTKMLQI